MLHERLFPEQTGLIWKEINLNQEAIAANFPENNPLLDAEFCGRWIEHMHLIKKCNFSFGGYLEDRSSIWRGHYHKPGHTIHLGIDFNVPAGTVVAAPWNCEVINSWVDEDRVGGWGGRLIVRYGICEYAIFGHLAPELIKEGTWVKKGTELGRIGDKSCNGNWYPHLHVQGMSEKMHDLYDSAPNTIDGYAFSYIGIDEDWPKVE